MSKNNSAGRGKKEEQNKKKQIGSTHSECSCVNGLFGVIDTPKGLGYPIFGYPF